MAYEKDDEIFGTENTTEETVHFESEPEAAETIDTVAEPKTETASPNTDDPSSATPLGSSAYTNTTYTGAYHADSMYGQGRTYSTGSSYQPGSGNATDGSYQANPASGAGNAANAAGGASADHAAAGGRAAYYSDATYSPYANGNQTKKPKEKNPDSFGRKLMRTLALALVFGLVAGLMFRFVGGVGFSGGDTAQVEEKSEEKQIETTIPSANANEDGAVESTPVSNVTLSTDVSEIVKETMPSIVQVSNLSLIQYRSFFGQLRTYEVPSAGSGIIISEDDEYIYIATNNHVVSNANELTITFCDDASVSAIIVGTDPEHDLAVVSVKLADVPAETLDAIRMAVIGDSNDLIVGQGAIVIGNALGYGQSVTVGYISARDREVTLQNDDGTEISNRLIQTDAAVNPGNSGGALLNMRGEVVGIVSAKYSDTSVEGMGYAIPITEAKDIIETIIAGGVPEESTPAAGTDLAPGTAYLGIYGMDLDEETAEQYSMPAGVYVSRIIRGSAADTAGLNRGDVILSIDGETVTSMEAVREYITAKKPGEKIEIVYSSWNSDYEEEETVTATLTAVPEQ